MIAEFAAALSTVKNSVDLLKTLRNVAQDEQVRNAVFDVQNDLLALQSKLFEANARFEEQSAKLQELQEKLVSIQRWDETMAKYKIVELYEGRLCIQAARYVRRHRRQASVLRDLLRVWQTPIASRERE